MEKVKILSLFGTRPEATKMCPLIKELEKCEAIDSKVCVTAQHREMLDQVLVSFGVTPEFDLDIMKPSQTLYDITSNALIGLKNIFENEKPDMVLVHGDTSTTFVGALAAYYQKIKVGHIEAGLRTNDKYQPFPEEMNRHLTACLADIHFAPTQESKNNLLKENISENDIFITGNTAVDCLKYTVTDNYKFACSELNSIDYKNKKVITMTAHRRENLGQSLENICNAVLEVVKLNPDVEVVYAVHSNPQVRETVYRILKEVDRVHLTDPLDMLDMHNLMKHSYILITDSGGIQEEAPGLNKPVLVLRNKTERPEGLKAGTLLLVGTEINDIVSGINKLIFDKELYNKMSNVKNPFGDGNASKRIVDAILYSFGLVSDRPMDFII